VKTTHDKIKDMLTDKDTLFDMLKTIGRDKHTTDKESASLIEELESLGTRTVLQCKAIQAVISQRKGKP